LKANFSLFFRLAGKKILRNKEEGAQTKKKSSTSTTPILNFECFEQGGQVEQAFSIYLSSVVDVLACRKQNMKRIPYCMITV
jgi:hypothetical protein